MESLITLEQKNAEQLLGAGHDGVFLGQCRNWTEPPLLAALRGKRPTVLYCNEPRRSFHDDRARQAMLVWPRWKKIWRMPTVRWMQEQMHRHILCADRVLCNSNFSRERISKAYPGCEPIVSYIGIDTDAFAPGPERREALLISVGALDPSKNHAMALRVAALRPAGQDFKVVIVADREIGEHADALRRLARELKIHLDIKVRISRTELIALYGRAMAAVYCPFEEPFGLTALEAMSCGTPVLGRREGGLIETIVDGQSGYLYMDDPAPFGERLAEWVRDAALYRKFSDSARQHVTTHWDQSELAQQTATQIEVTFRPDMP